MRLLKTQMQTNKKHIEFINHIVNGLTQKEAYKLSIGKKGVSNAVCEVKGSQLAKRYSIEIAQAKDALQKAIQGANNTEAAQKALKAIVTQAEADEKVFRILGSDDVVEEIVIINYKAQVVKRKPTQFEIQRSYDLYCKRFGSFSPVKQAIDHTGVIKVGYGKKE